MKIREEAGEGKICVYDHEYVDVDFLLSPPFQEVKYEDRIVNIFNVIRIFPSLGVSTPT